MENFQWSDFSHFFSAINTQHFLQKKYEALQIEKAEQLAYENCYPFMYYLEHGKEYYLQAINSPLIIQPILLFYGFVHLLKGVILTVNPHYPETTSVLAHGVSTRKRKKRDFYFWQDEVKIQRNGLFPFLAEHLFQLQHLEGEKFNMNDLFYQIPELSALIQQLDKKITFLPVKNVKNKYYIPKTILNYYHMTENRFIDYITGKSKQTLIFKKSLEQSLVFEKSNNGSKLITPFSYHFYENTFVLPVSNKYIEYNEILIHYLLLYNLSMIARYETEWWSELVKNKPNKDFPLIETFLTKTKNKGPFLIIEKLNETTKKST